MMLTLLIVWSKMGYCYDVNIVYSGVWKMVYGYDVNIVDSDVWEIVSIPMMLTLLIVWTQNGLLL